VSHFSRKFIDENYNQVIQMGMLYPLDISEYTQFDMLICVSNFSRKFIDENYDQVIQMGML